MINNLILELNSECNNNCIYCYLKDRGQAGLGSRHFFIDRLRKHKGMVNVDFTGGEPTMYKGLIPLVKEAKKLGYANRTIVTNGRLLSVKRNAENLVSAGITRAVITLDGPEKDVVERISQVPGSYSQVIGGIRNMKSLGCELGITTVVTKANYRHLAETADKAFSLGADFYGIQFMLPYIDDPNVDCRIMDREIIPSYSEVRPYAENLLDRFQSVNVHFIPFCELPGYEDRIDQEACKDDRLAVNFRGHGYNIGEHLRKGAVKTEKCKGCRYSDRCVGFFKSYARELGVSL